jgi:hypothetical protein
MPAVKLVFHDVIAHLSHVKGNLRYKNNVAPPERPLFRAIHPARLPLDLDTITLSCDLAVE